MDYTETNCTECGIKIWTTPDDPSLCVDCETEAQAGNDMAALDALATILSGRKLCGIGEEVAAIVRSTGREVSELSSD